MCRLAYYENGKGFDEQDVNILLQLAYNSYESSNRDGYFVVFSNGKQIRTLVFNELIDFIKDNAISSKSAMLHLRYGTHGKGEDWIHGWTLKDNKGVPYQVAHNGVFSTNDLDTETFANDSYQFFHNLFNSNKVKKKTLLNRLRDYSEEQGGNGVIGMYNRHVTIFGGVNEYIYCSLITKKSGDRCLLLTSKKDIIDFKGFTEIKHTEYKGLSFEIKKKIDVDFGIENIITAESENDVVFVITKDGIDEFEISHKTYVVTKTEKTTGDGRRVITYGRGYETAAERQERLGFDV